MATEAPSASRLDVMQEACEKIASLLSWCVTSVYGVSVDCATLRSMAKATQRPSKRGLADICFPCSMLCKLLKGNRPDDIAVKLAAALSAVNNEAKEAFITSVSSAGAYVLFNISPVFLGRIVPEILDGGFLLPLPSDKERVMVEYSQPNSHKAFHVGHMRNAALGDCLVRLFEQMGHPVVAANYFGDEGAHVAKCLWLLLKRLNERNITLDDLEKEVPLNAKGEYLGLYYAEATELLDLSTLTRYPYVGVVAAKVVDVCGHPNPEAPKRWKHVTVQYADDCTVEVVCGGEGYSVGDMVAYVPVGTIFNRQEVKPRDMMGVESHGIMLAYHELGLTPPKEAVEKAIAARSPTLESEDASAAKSQKKNKKNKKATANDVNLIFVLPFSEDAVGKSLAQLGSLAEEGVDVVAEHNQRREECKKVLRDLESLDPEMRALFERTRHWSISEFKEIYRWLGVRFDVDFYESEVGEESKRIVYEALKRGVLVESDGAIGADLSPFKLPFCLLIKSDGAGLYATKDLALAARKFRDFSIVRSVYVVDASQSLHFQQVFKVLEMLGFEQANRCFHLPYGVVTRPEGKMSSRLGTVIYFSQLRSQLNEHITKEYLSKYVGEWPDAEIESVLRSISISTIKYGMLNVDPAKDISFSLSEWSAKTGNTGPYLMYAYARIRSVLSRVPLSASASFDASLLSTDKDRHMLMTLASFWAVVTRATYEYNPSPLCKFLYSLSQDFMSWYEVSPVAKADTEALQQARLFFIEAVANVLKTGLFLLGIPCVDRM